MFSSLQQISPDYCEMRGVSILTASFLTGKDKADPHFFEKNHQFFSLGGWFCYIWLHPNRSSGQTPLSFLRAAKSTFFSCITPLLRHMEFFLCVCVCDIDRARSLIWLDQSMKNQSKTAKNSLYLERMN